MDVIIEFIKILPSILWALLALFALLLFHEQIGALFPRLKGFKGWGVELDLIEKSIDASVRQAEERDAQTQDSLEKAGKLAKGKGSELELPEKHDKWDVNVTSKQKELVLNRVKQHLEILVGAQVLWVDDHPEYNINERNMFGQLKVKISIAKSSQEALEMLKNDLYDLVLSDMARGDNQSAGIAFLTEFRKSNNVTPVIFYIGVIDPKKGVPPGAFGITNRPDELLNLTLDALERKKYIN